MNKIKLMLIALCLVVAGCASTGGHVYFRKVNTGELIGPVSCAQGTELHFESGWHVVAAPSAQELEAIERLHTVGLDVPYQEEYDAKELISWLNKMQKNVLGDRAIPIVLDLANYEFADPFAVSPAPKESKTPPKIKTNRSLGTVYTLLCMAAEQMQMRIHFEQNSIVLNQKDIKKVSNKVQEDTR